VDRLCFWPKASSIAALDVLRRAGGRAVLAAAFQSPRAAARVRGPGPRSPALLPRGLVSVLPPSFVFRPAPAGVLALEITSTTLGHRQAASACAGRRGHDGPRPVAVFPYPAEWRGARGGHHRLARAPATRSTRSPSPCVREQQVKHARGSRPPDAGHPRRRARLPARAVLPAPPAPRQAGEVFARLSRSSRDQPWPRQAVGQSAPRSVSIRRLPEVACGARGVRGARDPSMVVILGAGLAGLAAAHQLGPDGAGLERERGAGRPAAAARVKRLHLRPHGPPAAPARSRDPPLGAELLPRGWAELHRSAWIAMHGALVPYPFQVNTAGCRLDVRLECLLGFVEPCASSTREPRLRRPRPAAPRPDLPWLSVAHAAAPDDEPSFLEWDGRTFGEASRATSSRPTTRSSGAAALADHRGLDQLVHPAARAGGRAARRPDRQRQGLRLQPAVPVSGGGRSSTGCRARSPRVCRRACCAGSAVAGLHAGRRRRAPRERRDARGRGRALERCRCRRWRA
jgi:hypothetical protein